MDAFEISRIFACFNSTLVRLEVTDLVYQYVYSLCFNSTLVRLEVNCSEACKLIFFVSIPLWYD